MTTTYSSIKVTKDAILVDGQELPGYYVAQLFVTEKVPGRDDQVAVAFFRVDSVEVDPEADVEFAFIKSKTLTGFLYQGVTDNFTGTLTRADGSTSLFFEGEMVDEDES